MNDKLKQMCDKNSVNYDAGQAYLDSLRQHISYVQEAGRKIGVPEDQLLIHDESKFSEWEFPFYAKKFNGSFSPVDLPDIDLEFAGAWLHHENSNPHHWGYWIPRSGKMEGIPLPIPEKYIRELVADLMGASRAYTGSWDMSEWLNSNFGNMRLEGKTRQKVFEVLEETGHIAVWGNFEYTPKLFEI